MTSAMSYADAWMKWFHIVEAGAGPLSQRMIELAQIKAGATLLDVGTGIGEPALSVASQNGFTGRVIAIDTDSQMVEIGRRRAREKGFSNIEFVCSDIESISLDAASLDAVLARWSLMFVDNFNATLAKLAQAIRPGGRLVVATWAPPDQVPALTLAKVTAHRHLGLSGPEYGQGSPFCLSDRPALEAALSKAGFVDVASEVFAVSYRYDSAAQYLQNRIDVTGTLWESMESDPESTRETVFAAIEDALSNHRLPGGGLEFENHAICVSGRIG